jgi:hypothetical protein
MPPKKQPETKDPEAEFSEEDQDPTGGQKMRELEKLQEQRFQAMLAAQKQEFQEMLAAQEQKHEQQEQKLEQRLKDEIDVLKKSLRAHSDTKITQITVPPTDEIRPPKMFAFDPKAESFDNWLRTFDHRTRNYSDEVKAKLLVSHLTGMMATYGSIFLTNLYKKKPAVPVDYQKLTTELKRYLYGHDWADKKAENLLTKKQDKPIAMFSLDFELGLQDVAGFVDEGTVPTTDKEKLMAFVRLVDPEIKVKMKEYEKELSTIEEYVRKAELKGLGSHKRRPPGDSSPRPESHPGLRGKSRQLSDAQIVKAYRAANDALSEDSDPEFEVAYEHEMPYAYGYDVPRVGL